jgi:signal transduction histidine kinase
VLPPDLQTAAALGGEMGQQLLAFDWAGHPLGDPESWSPAVRATVATALACRFPTVLWLGERLHLAYNDAYIPVLGDKHPAALGAAGAEVWWDIWDVIGPMLHGVVKSGVATWSDDLMLMLVNEGRRRERYFTFTYSPIIGGDGRREGVFCAVTETTERVLGERRLQALSALSAALIDVQSAEQALAAAIEVCAVHDADLPFAAVYLAGEPLAEARLQAVTPGAAGLLPSSLPVLLGAADAGGVRTISALPALLPELAAEFGERCPEQALVLPIGERTEGPPAAVLVLGLNRWRPLDDQSRVFCGLLAHQVSAALASAGAYEAERRRAEVLAELDRVKTAFLTNVSHEFRTPLTLMLGPLEDALGDVPASSALAEPLETAQRNGRRLLRLVNSLLEFSRVEAGHSRPQLVTADLGALTSGIASSFADVCELAGIELVLDCRPAWALVDAEMWETIVLNLVSNAFKYTFTGSITVRAGPGADGGIQMSVSDTGTGIAADHLPHLFERF